MQRRTWTRLAAAVTVTTLGLTACSTDRDAVTDDATDTASSVGGEAEAVDEASGLVAPSAPHDGAVMADQATTGGSTSRASEPMPPGVPVPEDGQGTYAAAGFHDFTDPTVDPLSTFALDVDTASYSLARNWLESGQLPPPASVRLEEWVNAHDYGDAAPLEGTWAIHAEGGTSPLGPGRDLLRLGLTAREVADEDRPDTVLTFVVDTSGSMDSDDRIGLVRRALSLLVGGLRPTDQVGIVTYGSTAQLLLRPTPISESEQVLRAIDQLRAGGSTFAEGGIRLGYQVAAQAQQPGSTNMVVLLSDGVANVGETGPEAILAEIREAVDRGIRMTAVGVGMGNFNDVLLERLANDGDGTYWYVDTDDEARRVFVDGLTGLLTPIADEAKVQVEFNPAVVSSYRQLGYLNREIADESFRDESVDAGEVGAGHRVSATWEVVVDEGADRGDRVATVIVRWTDPSTGVVSEQERLVTVADLRTAGERFPLVQAVVAGAEVLAGSPHTSLTREDLPTLVAGLDDLGPAAAEFAEIMRTAARLRS